MVNLFPIQFLALFAYFILRVAVGGVLLYLGLTHWRERGVVIENSVPSNTKRTTIALLALFEIAVASGLLLGAYTQIAALGALAICLVGLLKRRRLVELTLPPRLFYVLLLAASLSLFITGAGAFAFDLPI